MNGHPLTPLAVTPLVVTVSEALANFGGPDTVPGKYKEAGRLFYEWNPSVTQMALPARCWSL